MCNPKLFAVVFVATAVAIPVAVFYFGSNSGRAFTFLARNTNSSGYFTRYYQVNYRSVEEIYDYMHQLVSNYTFFCKLHTIGHTGQKGELSGYPIHMISLSSGFAKSSVLVIGGIYANDWASVTSTLYLINELLTNCQSAGTLATSYNWKFIPILNPDGYNYSKSIPVGNHWIKNRAKWNMDDTGVNLNFNFGSHWKESFNFHEDTYPGIHNFSESESQILRNLIKRMGKNIKIVVILRSATKRNLIHKSYVTYPWSHTTEKVKNWFILQYLASLATRTTNKNLNSSYEIMQSGMCEPNQSGTIDDWIYGAARIKRVFIIQRDFKASLVMNPYNHITKLGREIYSIIKVIVMNALVHPSNYKETTTMNNNLSSTFSTKNWQ